MRPNPTRLAVAALTGALAVPATGAVSPAAAATRAEKQRGLHTSVYVQGDSLTVGSSARIKGQLGHQVRAVGVDAQVGRFTATGMSRLARDRRADRARVWVVALGTNDGPDAGRIKRYVMRSLRLAGDSREVIWVTLVRPGGYERVNRMLRTLDGQSDRLHVVDWARVVQRNPGLIAGDGVHGTARGYRVRGDLIARTALTLARQG